MGENMKVLENSASKALEKEEKLVDKILQLQHKYKAAEARYISTFQGYIFCRIMPWGNDF